MNKVEKLELIIIISLVLIFIITFSVMKSSENNLKNKTIDTSFYALKDYNRFFTIDSAISKYFSYVSAKEYDSVIKILDKNYVDKNKITKSNISNFISEYDVDIRSSLEEAYQSSSYNNIYKYYVKIALKKETLYDSTLQEYVYYIVTIDENNLLFAMEPISELIYSNKVKEEIKNE